MRQRRRASREGETSQRDGASPCIVLLAEYRSDQAAGERVPSSEIILTSADETMTTRGKAVLLIASSGFRDECLEQTGCQLQRLTEIDYAIKTGQTRAPVAIEHLVLGMG